MDELAKAIISNADGLYNAIDLYLAKVDKDLRNTIDAEGFAEPEHTVSVAISLENQIAAALDAQTEGLVETLNRAEEDDVTPKELKAKVSALLAADAIASDIEQTTLDMFEIEIPQLANVYMEESDGELVVDALRKRTSSWMQSWSEQLGELTKINTHQQITSLVDGSISSGENIADLTRKIQDGGWRNEYYQARRFGLTETLRAHSVAREESIQQSPACGNKEWCHTGAYKNEPRPNHVAMDGQVVPKDQPFELRGRDGKLYYPIYPRDPILPASESVNCHCIHRGVPNKDILGLSLEERKKLQEQIISEDDEEWKKALNAENKAKAGINVPGEREESKLKTDFKETLVEKQMIVSPEYRAKFNSLGENKRVSRSMCAKAKEMLRHRTGTEYEDLAYVDSKTGKSIINKSYNVKRKAKPNRPMNKMLKDADNGTIIGVHNHPGSNVPSYSDFSAAAQRNYKYGLVVCHNGTIYKYQIIGELNRPMAEAALDFLSVSGYSSDIAKHFINAGVELEVL